PAVSTPPAGSEPVRTWAPAPGQALAPAPARATCSPRPKRPGGALRIDGRQSMDGTCRHLRGRTTQDIDARPRLHARARPGLLRVHGDAPRAPASTLDRVQVVPVPVLAQEAAVLAHAHHAAAADAVAGDELDLGAVVAGRDMAQHVELEPGGTRIVEGQRMRTRRRMPAAQQIGRVLAYVGAVARAHQGLRIGCGRARVQRPAAGCIVTAAAAGAAVHQRRPAPPVSMKRRNSARVRASSRKLPSMVEVTMLTPRLCTPRVVMHSWLASTTTPTPCGASTRWMQPAICAVIFSCTWKRLA